MNNLYGEGNYWYRGEAPGTYGGGGGGGAGGGNTSSLWSVGPGQGINGEGAGGVYYDWYSGQNRSTQDEHIVSNEDMNTVSSTIGTNVNWLYFGGSKQNLYQILTGYDTPSGTKVRFFDNSKYQGPIYSGSYIFMVTYLHYQFGGTYDLNVSTSSLNLNGINMRTPEIQNIVKQGSGFIDLFKYMKNQTGLAIGSVQFNYLGNNTFSLSRDYYDFDIRWRDGITWRNIGTFGAGLLHGPVIDNMPIGNSPSFFFGGPYWINFHGTITLNP